MVTIYSLKIKTPNGYGFITNFEDYRRAAMLFDVVRDLGGKVTLEEWEMPAVDKAHCERVTRRLGLVTNMIENHIMLALKNAYPQSMTADELAAVLERQIEAVEEAAPEMVPLIEATPQGWRHIPRTKHRPRRKKTA
jgi:hypothetical protein